MKNKSITITILFSFYCMGISKCLEAGLLMSRPEDTEKWLRMAQSQQLLEDLVVRRVQGSPHLSADRKRKILDPYWDEDFSFEIDVESAKVILKVLDKEEQESSKRGSQIQPETELHPL